MSTLAVEDLQDTFLAGLRARAAVHGWTLQQEVQAVLEAAGSQVPASGPDQEPEAGFLDSVDLLERSLEEDWRPSDQDWVLAFLPER
jgi:plasmid stability protein